MTSFELVPIAGHPGLLGAVDFSVLASMEESSLMPGSRMFSFITHPGWNPIRFCSHQCMHCWAVQKMYCQDPEPG